VIVSSCILDNIGRTTNRNSIRKKDVSFEAKLEIPLYEVKNANVFKKILPTLALLGSIVGSLGYLIGGTGLFYDLYYEKHNKINNNDNSKKGLSSFFDKSPKDKKPEEGVKTIEATTKFGKIGINCARTAVAATAAAGMACGLGEGIPLMALGEATNLSSAKIIETPVGTGLFGIGIASIFAGLALDNTPNLKLNYFELMAEKRFANKAKLILKNMLTVAKEISISIWEILKYSYKPKFWKENILRITPKNVIFSEVTNKDGKLTLQNELRHNKNIIMHAASFTLAVGGFGIIISSLLNQKKAQKIGLQVEEGGFLFDNFGMTKFGLDKFTTGGKSAGASFAIGGAINAVSQCMGIDNKDGRALQWLGISGVFLGYAIDRGKHLRDSLKNAKARSELTQIVREWKIDLSDFVENKAELRKLLKEIKTKKAITNDKFKEIKKIFDTVLLKKGEFDSNTKAIKEEIASKLDNLLLDKAKNRKAKDETFAERFKSQEVMEYEKAKNMLKICTEKTFGKKPNKVGTRDIEIL